MEIVFWISFVFVFYVFVGYFFILLFLTYIRRVFFLSNFHPRYLMAEPFISVVIPIHNGAEFVENKMRSIKENGYPLDKMELLIGLDGCTDDSMKQLMKWENVFPNFKVFNFSKKSNKSNVLNALVQHAQGVIVCFTDIRQELAPGAFRALIDEFYDSSIGVVSSELVLRSADGSVKGLGLYWRYEKIIRSLESELDSVSGATGALYAIRRDCIPKEIPSGILLDDVYIPMNAVLRGRRILFSDRAIVYDSLQGDAVEFRRKVRTLVGNWQILRVSPWLLNPFKNRIFWQYVSHKVFRLLSSIFLALLYFSSAYLAFRGNGFYTLFFIAQSLFYIMGVIGFFFKCLRKGIFGISYNFMLLNIAAWIAMLRALKGDFSVDWR